MSRRARLGAVPLGVKRGAPVSESPAHSLKRCRPRCKLRFQTSERRLGILYELRFQTSYRPSPKRVRYGMLAISR